MSLHGQFDQEKRGVPVHRTVVSVALLILVPGLTIIGSAQTKKPPPKPFPYKRVVLVGWAKYKERNSCADFVGFMTSANFFEGLEARDTLGGRVFFKDGKQVSEFPEELRVEVQSVMSDCTTGMWFPDSVPLTVAERFMNALSFKLEWKRELEERPAQYSTAVSSPESAFWPEYDPPSWTFEFNVQSHGVPLTDHLVIEVHSENQRLVTRLEAHL